VRRAATLTPKGEARREALLAAVLRVLAREGATGVTHRSVAKEAGVPAAAATYYFATLDDLLVTALRRATLDQVASFESLRDPSLTDFATVLHRWVTDDRGAAIAQYELLFLAMRRDTLRPDAELWYRALERAIDPESLHGARTRVTALAIDGLLLRMLWLGEPATLEDTTAALREIVGR
jgi:DNA-binding transcriptional regulator YbjK